jgi:putative ABC transport system substrate-binding protein
MNKRRALLVAFGLGVSPWWPLFAQQRSRVWRIGILSPRSKASLDSDPFRGFVQGMADLGYVDGKDVEYAWRFAEGKYEQLPALVAELIELNVDVLVAGGTPGGGAAQNATHNKNNYFLIKN